MARLAAGCRREAARRPMTERNDGPRDAVSDPPPPDPAADIAPHALSPALWVTALIALTLLLLAAFALV